MRLSISHETRYQYDAPVSYALQQLRLTPKSSAGQTVLDWKIEIVGGNLQCSFTDHHNNKVDLIRFAPDVTEIIVRCKGEIETADRAGVIGPHGGYAPLWLFRRHTRLTKPGPEIKKLAKLLDASENSIAQLHTLNDAILAAVNYTKDETNSATTAEEALTKGKGVCQDHAHIFISAAREAGYPARYVSGFLMTDDIKLQNAGHAWAEAYVDNIGWIGFDPPNEQCPDERYVRVATGRDSREASPISGLVQGDVEEKLVVSLQVQQ
ncbi:transglutaminase family protein [Hirschia baltica]|uniref:Transglutaminase domain protein n=1 Tax=Hirschia baltica (strain ATCC 49814 / DSM 5838 / IFAM 1418) TaxID=582402 RepID=C6XLI3_HIRBI|nr:transglutaminase family protein [Hirschia baltica]ACT59782.1 transglutaminase domain protein [Hirschia baltica ATCC 49814]